MNKNTTTTEQNERVVRLLFCKEISNSLSSLLLKWQNCTNSKRYIMQDMKIFYFLYFLSTLFVLCYNNQLIVLKEGRASSIHASLIYYIILSQRKCGKFDRVLTTSNPLFISCISHPVEPLQFSSFFSFSLNIKTHTHKKEKKCIS